MDKIEFVIYSKSFAPMITKIINDNVRFYRFNETIKWRFGYDEDIRIMAGCNRNSNLITINLKSIMEAYYAKDNLTIEYFLLHEIRHAFQNSIIANYKEGKEIPIDEEIVKSWIKEGQNYIKSCDEDGKENEQYFLQDSELDAYAFSFAVMKYKYKDVSNLFLPKVYGDNFFEIVTFWIETFKNEQL